MAPKFSSLRRRAPLESEPPAGPVRIEDMFLRAENTWEALRPENQQLLTANVSAGVELLSFYSGKGSAESMLYQIVDRVLQAEWTAGSEDLRPGLPCPLKSLSRRGRWRDIRA